ncbi:uncharacterized protein LOC117783009 [Drosophila innubila]|uniref:uncharacterized protein LOC117783009 n=1 Tax=Drosophila innubila TaxID=198719 RepID=UPI00148CD5FA|nr:uncharacterized protein LOC117783009 [Drosophila innubila]
MKMFFNHSSIKNIHIYTLVILICQAHGNGSYLNARNRDYGVQRNTDSSKLVKSEDGGTVNVNNGLVEGGAVRTVGEVFVPKTFPLSSQEPSCEELRAMWIFSKRQSRAAEITNEIPTYRDPFTYNIWEPLYPNSRMLGSMRMGTRERARSPVFGRVVSREPIVPQRVAFEQRQRHSDGGLINPGQTRFYGSETRPTNAGSSLSLSSSSPPSSSSSLSPSSSSSSSSPRRTSKNRYMGVPNSSGDNLSGVGGQNSVAVQGSFQKLKELIWTERAKELTQQRRSEELAARAAVLKEIANGQNIQGSYKTPFSNPADSFLMDENRSPDRNDNQYLNVDRLSIANGQTFDSKNNNNKNNKNAGQRNNGGRASTRRIGSAYGGSHAHAHSTGSRRKETFFSRKSAQGQGSAESESNFGGDLSDRDQTVVGIPRTYPVRQSHFRERNRSLFKQNSPSDYFHRDTRKLNRLQMATQSELPSLRSYLNVNYLSPSTSFENDMKPDVSGLIYLTKELANGGEESSLMPEQYLPIIEQDELDFYDYK